MRGAEDGAAGAARRLGGAPGRRCCTPERRTQDPVLRRQEAAVGMVRGGYGRKSPDEGMFHAESPDLQWGDYGF